MPSATLSLNQSLVFNQKAPVKIRVHKDRSNNNYILVSFPANFEAEHVRVTGETDINLHSKKSNSIHYFQYSGDRNNAPTMTVHWTGSETATIR